MTQEGVRINLLPTECHLLITFANSLKVKPDLDPNCLKKLSADCISR